MLIEQIYKPLLMCHQEHRVTKCQIALGFTATILLAPIGIVASLVDTLIGIIQGIGYAFTKKTSWHESMEKTFAQAALPLAMPVRMLLRFSREKKLPEKNTRGPASYIINGSFGEGGILHHAEYYADTEDNYLKRHVISRLLFLLSGLVGTICRVADLVIGLISLVCICCIKNINALDLVESGFMITGIFSDLGLGLAKFIYPFES